MANSSRLRGAVWFLLAVIPLTVLAQALQPQAPANLLVDGQGGQSATCSAPANTPGGPDGQGGCFPSASSTGYRGTLTSYGSCTINTNGTTINSKVIDCEGSTLVINASNVTITNSYIKGPVEFNGTALTMTDVEIDATPTPGRYITGYAFDGDSGGTASFTRINLHGGRSNFWCPHGCSMVDSYTWGVEIPSNSDAHMSAARFEANNTFTHNSIACDFYPPTSLDGGCSADLTGYPDFAAINHLTVVGNLFVANAGAAYCVYAGASPGKPYSNDPTNATYIVFRDNVFQRGSNNNCAAYGPATDFAAGRVGNVWQNNRWSDGTTITSAN